MPARSPASPDAIEMSSVFGALRSRLPRLIALSLLTGGLTYAALMTLAPKFQSETEVEIVAKGPASALADPKAAGGPDTVSVRMDKEAVNTHVRALLSDDLLAKIAGELNLNEKREFNSAKGPVDFYDTIMRTTGAGGPRNGESEHDRVMGALKRQLEIYAQKETRTIGIRATATEPELAAAIANGIAEGYRKALASAATQEVGDQQKVLEGKIGRLVDDVAAAETEAERYRGEINVFKGGAQNTGLNEQQLSELTAELSKAKASRSEADARAKSAHEMMKSGSADALPDVQKSPLIQNLVQQRVRIERQISELSATLLPGHPRMQQLTADLAGLKRQLTGETSKVVDSLDKEAKVAQGREDSIKKSLDELKASVVKNAPEEAKLRQLQSIAATKRTELESLQAQVEGNRKRLDTRAQPVEVQIVKTAAASSLPVFPKKTQSAALIAFATLLFGAFLTITGALFKGAREETIATERHADAAKSVKSRAEPVLPSPERLKADAKQASARPIKFAADVDTTAIAAAAARFRKAVGEQGGHRAIVTGSSRDIDCGNEAVALASALSQSGGHVILINWNTVGKAIAGLGDDGTGDGISDLVMGRAGFDDVVRRLPGSRAHYIGCGNAVSDPATLDPDHLNLVLDALDEAYDHIIVTGPYDDTRDLFQAIQGRFDAGLEVFAAKAGDAPADAKPGRFLGFEVADIDVIRVGKVVEKQAPPVPGSRVQRATRTVNAKERAAS